jgi:hypothetical protein
MGPLLESEHAMSDTKPLNGYIALYRGKRLEVYAESSYAAQTKAAALFKARKSYEVSVYLAVINGEPYVQSTAI